MLPKVYTPTQSLEKYRELIPKDQMEEIQKLGKELKGLRLNLVNSTPRGGGVAEILKSLVPLMKGVGIRAKWYTIPPRDDFFKITKEIHNALQGKSYDFPFSHRKRYLHHMERTVQLMGDMKADAWVVHDPQPAGLIQYLPRFHPSICRLHIDLSTPNQEVWDFIAGFLESYDKIIVSSKQFVKPEFRKKTVVIPPAIDPLMPKNIPLDPAVAKQILRSYGINLQKPLITQVSRFDAWKDPLGVIKAYQIAKKKIPDLQLALVGFFMAMDDPEAVGIYHEVKKEAGKDLNIFLFSDPNLLGSLRVDTFTCAIQTGSDIILQKSIREGFGLTITEAMWKRKPVIGGKAEGIKTQIQSGHNGFLAAGPGEAAKRIVEIIQNPKLAERLGENAHQTVKEKFLMPRLLRDHLRILKRVVIEEKDGKRKNINSKKVIATLASYS